MRLAGKRGMMTAGKHVDRRVCSHSKSEKRRQLDRTGEGDHLDWNPLFVKIGSRNPWILGRDTNRREQIVVFAEQLTSSSHGNPASPDLKIERLVDVRS